MGGADASEFDNVRLMRRTHGRTAVGCPVFERVVVADVVRDESPLAAFFACIVNGR